MKYMVVVDVVLLFLYCGFIFYLSHQSALPVGMLFMHQDKLMHAAAYGVMALLAWRVLHVRFQHGLLVYIGALLFCSLYGVSDEFHQSFIVGRDADLWDWLADTTGAAIVLSLLWRWQRGR